MCALLRAVQGSRGRACGAQTWEDPLLWAGLCAAVGVRVDSVARPEDVAAARRAAAIRPMAGFALLDPRHSLRGGLPLKGLPLMGLPLNGLPLKGLSVSAAAAA